MNIDAVISQMNINNQKKILNHMIPVATNLKQYLLQGDPKLIRTLSICCWSPICLWETISLEITKFKMFFTSMKF